MRKISKKIIVLLLVAIVGIAGGIYIGLSEPEDVSGGTGNLQAGDWVFLNASNYNAWKDDGVLTYFQYQSSSGTKQIIMMEYEKYKYCVRIPSDISGDFKFCRISTNGTSGNNGIAPEHTTLTLPTASNVFVVSDNYNGSWSGSWESLDLDERYKPLDKGDYIVLDVNGTVWNEAEAKYVFKYIDVNNTEKEIVMTSYGTGKYKVMIPDDIGSDGQFKFFRLNPDNSAYWNKAPGPDTAWLNLDTLGNNVFLPLNWYGGTWTDYIEVPKNNAGKTIYFLNMEGTTIDNLTAQFSVSTDQSTAKSPLQMTYESTTMSGLYSVVIPGAADYDTVEFIDSLGNVLATQKIMEDEYDPDNNINTYFYNATKTPNDANNVSFWGTLPSDSSNISGKELYIDATVFKGDNVTIKVGDNEAETLTADEDDNTIYRYVIPSTLNATQKTIITITANDGTSYNFLWSDLTKDKVTISDNNVAEVSKKYVSNVKVMYFINMGNTPIDGNIEAKFNSTTTATTVKIKTMTQEEGFNGLLYRVTVPSGYDIVQFTSNGVNLGVTQKIEGGSYSSDLNNTFYYDITEKSNGNISVWYEYPEGTESIAEKKLYFEAESFEGGSVTIKVGDSEAVKLEEDEDNSDLLSYTIPIGSVATQRTIITVNVDDTLYHFLWSDILNNKATVSSDVAYVSEIYVEGNVVYFDATLSKLQYVSDDTSNNDRVIPNSNSEVWYHAWKSTNTSENQTAMMTKCPEYTKNGNTWKDVYMAILPDGYDMVLFMNGNGAWSSKTENLEIPSDLSKRCFYADSSDHSIYVVSEGTRSGYWGKVYTVRNAEKGKVNSDIVDVDDSTKTFDRDPKILYVNTTLFDYYSDYELNGFNRDEYDASTAIGSHRIYQPFRHFNQALSDYYRKNSATSPLYWGNMQNYNYFDYKDIADTLDLYGYAKSDVDPEQYKKFFYENNGMWRIDGENTDGYRATIGLTSNTMLSGSLMLKTDSGNDVIAPFFDEDFIMGNNSKNAVLGQVYHNVSFPFVKEKITEAGATVEYWYYNSADNTKANKNLQLKQASSNGKYYLASTDEVVNGSDASGNPTDDGNFFPFNTGDESGNARILNYGFGQKLEFTFRLTSGGEVVASNGTKVPIKFEFKGDDDVWVFIDGELILDIGGAHDTVTGTIDFANKKATVSGVKNPNGGDDLDNVGTYFPATMFNDEEFYSKEHTLTMYYMERGLWESNMEIIFNFPDENKLSVEKEVDTSKVNDIFKHLFTNMSVFNFNIKNHATHYGEQLANTGDEPEPFMYNQTFDNGTVKSASTSNKFEYVKEYDGQSDVVQWYAQYTNTDGLYTDKRWGIVYPSAGVGTSVDVSKQNVYLQFKVYYAHSETPELKYMRIELEDSGGKTIGGTINGKTYGNSSITPKQWTTLQIDLRLFEGYDVFDFEHVTKVKVGYDHPRDIIFDAFVFKPAVNPTTLVGFTMEQRQIPDYGSSQNGILQNAVNATYSSKKADGTIEYGRVNEEGIFVLAAGQKITFSNQFRRGSYIYLKENINEEVFDVTWKIYDAGEEVTSSVVPDGNTTASYGVEQLSNEGVYIKDLRQEAFLPNDSNDNDKSDIANAGYQVAGLAKLDENTTTNNTFLFRSYTFPDSEVVGIDLLIKEINTVKTGALTISKERAENSPSLEGYEFTFHIEFSSVAGMGLDSVEYVFKLKDGESKTIEGIPAGTVYTITEIIEEDSNMKLETIEQTVEGNDQSQVVGNTMVQGKVVADDDATPATEFVFKNSYTPTINLNLKKLWVKGDGTTAITEGLPESIWVQIQRKTASDATFTAVDVPGSIDGCIEIVPGYEGWIMQIVGLNKYHDNTNQKEPYIYRVVEMQKVDENTFKPVDKTFWYDGSEFEVGYSEVIDLTNSDIKNFEFKITNKSLEYFDFSFTKVNGSVNDLPKILGAEFILYEYKGDVSLDTYEAVMAEIAKIADGNTSGTSWVIHKLTDTTGDVNADAVYTVSNLSRKSVYYLVESRVPAGMQLPNGCWKIEFVTGTSTDVNVHDNVRMTAMSQNGSDMPAFGYETNLTVNDVKGWFITNLEQWDIPETGGIGLTYPYMAGICLMLIAVVWGGTLYYRDRRRQKT